MNILISCSGKQVNLMCWFKELLDEDSLLIACDNNEFSPSFSIADKYFVAPTLDSPDYKDWFFSVCKENNVSLVLSLYESDLIILASMKDQLNSIGCKLVGAEEDTIKHITDKYLAKELLKDTGIQYPQTELLSDFSSNSFSGPYIVKPRLGRGSRGIKKFEDVDSVIQYQSEVEDPSLYVVQEFINGPQFCFDVLNDLHSNFITTFIRRRLKMGSEETETAVTENNHKLHLVGQRLSNVLKHQGSIDVDAIEHNNSYYIVDVNVRFGGSYAFSHIAGANIPGALISWARGNSVPSEYLTHEYGVVGSKYNSVTRLK